MSKVTIKIILYAAGAVMVFVLLFQTGQRYYRQYDDIAGDVQAVRYDPGIEAVVLGSSHAFCVMPKTLGYEKGLLMNHGGADSFEVRYQAENIAEIGAAVKTVLISISYFSFAMDNGSYVDEQGSNSRRENRVMLYAGYPSWTLISKWDVGNLMFGKFHPVFTPDHWRAVFTGSVKKPSRNDEGWDEAVDDLDRERKRFLLDRHAKARVKRFHGFMNVMQRENPDLQEEAYEAVKKTAQVLTSKGVRVVFFTPPYWSTYTKHFDKRHRAFMRKSMRAIVKETGVEYHDFSGHAFFQHHPELFLNSDHLNQEGYVVFNDMLEKAMKAHESYAVSSLKNAK